ncbi:hypothetical protein FAUST_11949 [Fusarium austroamericanum]|uniref:Ankyrin n=1 Tax=Fusarium austroamericanum TaxID=282268 RepID=A0AAN5YY83_FUSAU|nr:hypothetical protein FAUST_11949 [Fusarium austroamericanum]
MPRLVALFLRHTRPDPDDVVSKFFPSPLYMASWNGQGSVVEALLQGGARTDVKRKGIYSPIYTVAGNGNISGAEVLVSRDDALLESSEPERPLCIASTIGQWKMAKRLIEMGSQPNGGVSESNLFGVWAPLVVAADGGYLRTMNVLLEKGADPNIPGPTGKDTPLWFAAVRAADWECVRLLLEKGADPNHQLLDPPILVEVVRSSQPREKRLAITTALLTGSDPAHVDASDDDGLSPLLHAAKQGDLSIVKLLLKRGACVDAKDNGGYSALAYAAKNKNVQVVQELLKKDSDLNVRTADKETLLEIAMEDVETMRVLLDARVDKDGVGQGNSPAINVATARERTDVVKLLAESKAGLEHFDSLGWNPILDATGYTESPEITRILVENGANLRVTTSAGSTPLHFAAVAQDSSVLRVLLEFRKNFDIEARNLNGCTPLFRAAEIGRMESARLLIRAGADVNTARSDGVTALMCAISAEHSALVDLFLSQPEIELYQVNVDKKPILIWACQKQDLDSVVKLVDKGADPNTSYEALVPTPLIASCVTRMSPDGYTDKPDQIVRYLVEQGAQINSIHSTTFFNPLSAAAFAASTSTVSFLIDKGAFLDYEDPMGRFSIHFAAAGGFKNFEAVNAAYSGDLLASDCGGKNVLHWAAQFGQIKTLKAILQILDPSGCDRKHYVDLPDIDGWTPLCWATRPMKAGYFLRILSEPPDYLETVKYLVQEGANRSVEFFQGDDENREQFTPAKMVRLCAVDDEIMKALLHREDANIDTQKNYHDEEKEESRRVYTWGHFFQALDWREFQVTSTPSDSPRSCQSPAGSQVSEHEERGNDMSDGNEPVEENRGEISSIDSEDLESSDNE